MSFSKAPVKRFNDVVSEGPAPDAYDVKELGPKGSGFALPKTDRFVAPKDITPGPGQYEIEAKKSVRPRQSLARQSSFKSGSNSSRGGSRASSTTSLYTEVDDNVSFKTPVKKNTEELAHRYEQVCQQLTSTNEELARCRQEVETLRENLLAKGQELESKENELKGRNHELSKALEEQATNENQVLAMQSKLEEIQCRESSLAKELELLNQDNLSLEEKITESTRALLEEKIALEEKSTFLHFTQEQLNSQVETLQGQVAQLTQEVIELQARISDLEKELVSERTKLSEFTEMYVRENTEAESEFGRLQTEIKTLKTQKESLEAERVSLESSLKSLESQLRDVEEEKSGLKSKLEEALSDVDVLSNDKEVLDSERKRLETEKNELGLDLMAVTSEKMEVERTLASLEDEKIFLLAQAREVLAQKSIVEAKVDENSAKISEFVEEISMQKINLTEKEQAISELQSEIEELEMKNSSLEGSLSATQNEVSNLEAENKALFASFEKVEETVRGYIHRCQDLEVEADELRSAKEDLNQTCVILEERMVNAEKLALEKATQLIQFQSEVESKEELVTKLRGDVAALETKGNDLQELVRLLEQRHATCQEISAETEDGLRRKISELESNLSKAENTNEKLSYQLQNLQSEHEQLIEMNQELSQQVSEGFATTQRLTSREEELVRRLERTQKDLENAHQGLNIEVGQKWEAEDEILQLQTELDQATAMLQESNEQVKFLHGQQKAIETRLGKISDAKDTLEAECKGLKLARDQAVQDLALFREEQGDVSERLRREIEARSDLEKKLKMAQESESLLKDRIDIQGEELSQLKLDFDSQQNLMEEKQKEIDELEEKLQGSDRKASYFKEMEMMLEEYLSDVKELEAKEASLKDECARKDVLIEELRKELDPLQEETQTYKEKYEALLSMIEPFREQLESFEMEKAALLSQNQESKSEVKKLASQYAQLLGHQNHKQKIQHLVKIKEENVSMREQISKLQLENSKLKRTVGRLESRCNSTANLTSTRFNGTQADDKENDESVFYTPMPAPPMSKFIASTPNFRRQTIASPLTSRNRP